MTDKNRMRDDTNELNVLKGYLKDADMEALVLEQSKTFELPTLVQPLPNDSKDRARVFTMNFVPLEKEDVEYTRFLQIHCELPFTMADGREIETLRILNMVNQVMAVGSFTLQGDKLSYRYVFGSPIDAVLDEGVFMETMFMMAFMLDLAQDPIESVAAGEATAADAFVAVSPDED